MVNKFYKTLYYSCCFPSSSCNLRCYETLKCYKPPRPSPRYINHSSRTFFVASWSRSPISIFLHGAGNEISNYYSLHFILVGFKLFVGRLDDLLKLLGLNQIRIQMSIYQIFFLFMFCHLKFCIVRGTHIEFYRCNLIINFCLPLLPLMI